MVGTLGPQIIIENIFPNVVVVHSIGGRRQKNSKLENKVEDDIKKVDCQILKEKSAV